MANRLFRLTDLNINDDFISRHIGTDANEQRYMLDLLGLPSLQALIDEVVPQAIYSPNRLALSDSCTEQQALAELRDIADSNQVLKSYIGQGYFNCHTPSVIQRNISMDEASYKAFTEDC